MILVMMYHYKHKSRLVIKINVVMVMGMIFHDKNLSFRARVGEDEDEYIQTYKVTLITLNNDNKFRTRQLL